MTRNHRTLLQCCTDSNIEFVSGRSTTAPERIGHGCIQHVYSMSTLGVPPVSGYLSGGPCTQSRVGASRPADLDHLDHVCAGGPPSLPLTNGYYTSYVPLTCTPYTEGLGRPKCEG